MHPSFLSVCLSWAVCLFDLCVLKESKEYMHVLKRLEEIRGKKVSQEELAKILTGNGKKTSQERISNTIRLLKLAEPVQRYLALNRLGIYKGLLLLQITDEKTQIDLAHEFIEKNYTDANAEARIKQFKEQLTNNKARGQYMLHNDGSHYLPSPEIIQPYKKIKLQLVKPHCPRVVEMIHEGAKLQCNNCETCPTCPLEDLCGKFTRYRDLLEKER